MRWKSDAEILAPARRHPLASLLAPVVADWHSRGPPKKKKKNAQPVGPPTLQARVDPACLVAKARRVRILCEVRVSSRTTSSSTRTTPPTFEVVVPAGGR